MSTILICENSLEGVFSGIYDAYARRLPAIETHLQIEEETEPMLFCSYCRVQPDEEHFVKVRRTLIERLGWEVYEWICMALAQEKEGMADAVYHTVVKGLSRGVGTGPLVLQNLTDEFIHRVYMAGQRSAREIDHMRGFVRFEEREGLEKLLYAKIAPEGNILPFLAPHFADRLPCENFIIHDVRRGLFVVHPKERAWYMLADGGDGLNLPDRSEKEEEYRQLFKSFCHSIAIKERCNPRLQCQMLPLRYRDFMVEF